MARCWSAAGGRAGKRVRWQADATDALAGGRDAARSVAWACSRGLVERGGPRRLPCLRLFSSLVAWYRAGERSGLTLPLACRMGVRAERTLALATCVALACPPPLLARGGPRRPPGMKCIPFGCRFARPAWVALACPPPLVASGGSASTPGLACIPFGRAWHAARVVSVDAAVARRMGSAPTASFAGRSRCPRGSRWHALRRWSLRAVRAGRHA
jgi:hypothetical protein